MWNCALAKVTSVKCGGSQGINIKLLVCSFHQDFNPKYFVLIFGC